VSACGSLTTTWHTLELSIYDKQQGVSTKCWRYYQPCSLQEKMKPEYHLYNAHISTCLNNVSSKIHFTLNEKFLSDIIPDHSNSMAFMIATKVPICFTYWFFFGTGPPSPVSAILSVFPPSVTDPPLDGGPCLHHIYSTWNTHMLSLLQWTFYSNI